MFKHTVLKPYLAPLNPLNVQFLDRRGHVHVANFQQTVTVETGRIWFALHSRAHNLSSRERLRPKTILLETLGLHQGPRAIKMGATFIFYNSLIFGNSGPNLINIHCCIFR